MASLRSLVLVVLATAADGGMVDQSALLTETCIKKMASMQHKGGNEVIQDLATKKGWHSAAEDGQVSSTWASSTWSDIQKESESQRASCFGIQTTDASPIQMYVDMFNKNIRSDQVQIPLSLVTLAVGCWLLYDGLAAWRITFTIFCGLFGAVIARHEALAWDLTPNIAQESVLMFQAGMAVSLAVHVGYEGSQILSGMLIGILSAYGLGGWVREVMPGLAVVWYVVGGGAGFVCYTVFRPVMLSLISSMVGGWLAVSSMGLLVSRLWHVASHASQSMPSHLWGTPTHEQAVIVAAGDLLGIGEHYAIPWHCGCATIAVLLRYGFRIDWLSIVTLVASIAFELGGTVSCKANLLPKERCPNLDTFNWQWMLVGDLLWIGLMAFSANRQLGKLSTWEASSFWTNACPCIGGVEDDDERNDDTEGCAGYGDRERELEREPELKMPPWDAGLAAHWEYAQRTMPCALPIAVDAEAPQPAAKWGCIKTG